MDYKRVLSALEYVVYMLDKYYFSTPASSSSLIPVSEVSNVEIMKENKKKPAKKVAKKGGKK
jgi:hypothetical protein